MKLEFDISDIAREHLVDAMAEKLLTQYVRDEDTGGAYRDHSPLARQMKEALEQRIDELAAEQVRDCFDEIIKARIVAAVDEVLAEGWRRTDEYGNPRGDKLDLKGRISEHLTKHQSGGYGREARTFVDELVHKTVESVFTRELQGELEKARKSLRAQLDAVVAGKVAETIKQALGLG